MKFFKRFFQKFLGQSSTVSIPDSPTGQYLKDGLSWITKPLKVYVGGSFQVKQGFYWDGSVWKEINTSG